MPAVLAAVLAACLLLAQWGTLDHAVHHPFHKHTQLCDAFIVFDHGKAALIPLVSLVVFAVLFRLRSRTHRVLPAVSQPSLVRVRGPPSPRA